MWDDIVYLAAMIWVPLGLPAAGAGVVLTHSWFMSGSLGLGTLGVILVFALFVLYYMALEAMFGHKHN
jgi:hypothetical protein